MGAFCGPAAYKLELADGAAGGITLRLRRQKFVSSGNLNSIGSSGALCGGGAHIARVSYSAANRGSLMRTASRGSSPMRNLRGRYSTGLIPFGVYPSDR